MRWKEEVTLTTYEMQWTVRYFDFKSRLWAGSTHQDADSSSPVAGPSHQSAEENHISAGVLAYRRRKQSTWLHLAKRSDRTFILINNAYKSPL